LINVRELDKLLFGAYTVNIFTDADECIDYITDIMTEETFVVISEAFSEIIIPIVHDIPQVISIYCFVVIRLDVNNESHNGQK
jgi:hypothetical protein